MAYSVTSATRSVTPAVAVGGIALQNIVSASVHFALDSPVPTADVTVAGKLPDWIQRNMSVTIDLAGRLFTGKVKRRQHSPGQSTIQCVGKTQKLWQPFKVAGWVFTNVSAQAAVETILNDVGITDRSIDMVAWQIGVVQDAIIDVTTPGDAVQKIIDVDGHRMFELPSGGLVIRKLLAAPAPSPFRTYTTTGTAPWVNDISDDEDPDQVKKEVIVSGAALGSQDSEGNAGQTQIESPPVFTDSNDLVEGPHELYSMNYQNDLIEDVAKATAVALRLLDKYHRIIERISMTVPLDPDIRLAMTIGIQDAAVTGRTVNWFVEGYTHTFADGQCETTLDLMGGDQSGTSGKVAPIADFVYKVEHELIGTQMRALVSCHSLSVDLDGTIANYHWTDTYNPPNDKQGANLVDISFVYDPTVMTTVDITLEVTDNDGYKTSITKTIYIGPGAVENQFVPTIAAACTAGTGAGMFTPDGGFTWHDKAAPSGQFISVSAAEYGGPDDLGVILLGTNNGKIYRSTDQLATAPTLVFTEPAGSPINHIWWDTNVQNRVWACTQNGRLYWSVGGATWELYHDFGGSFPLTRIATPKGPPVVFVFGGRGDAPYTLIQWNWQDNSEIWFQPDMSAFTPSAAADHIAEAAANVFPELCIIFTGTRQPAIMYTADLYASPVVWQNAVGLAAGLVDGRFVCPEGAPVGEEGGTAGTFLAAFADKEMWTTADGVNWHRTVEQLPAPGAPTLSKVAGSLANGTYGYRVSALNDNGETLASAETTIVIADGPKGVRVTWAAVTGATGYKIYGRTPGAELFMAQVAVVTQWDDNGSIVPSGALPSVNSTSWVLPGTAANKPWHAMNVKDHPTLFFGASIEGLWKTTDGGVKVNFIRPAAGISTWPASALGRMISFVAQAAESNQEPDEVWLIYVNVARTSVNLCKLAGTSWEIIKQGLDLHARKLQWFGTKLFYQSTWDSMTWGDLMLSTDEGLTFNPVLANCSAVTQGPDGTFWACTHSTGAAYPTDVYIHSSPTAAAGSWTQRAHFTSAYAVPFNSIAVNPNNAQQVVAIAGYSTIWNKVAVSLDGGATWTLKNGPSHSGGDDSTIWIIWGQNQRLIAAHHQHCKVSVSDDFGGTWTLKYTATPNAIDWQNFIRCGMWLFGLIRSQDTDMCLARSSDNGDTWEELHLNTIETKHALAYNPDGERLFIFYSSMARPGTDPAPVARMKPATATKADLEASWTVMQYDWDTKIGTINGWPQGGLAIRVG
jgi:hypothetical protein